MHTNLNFLTDTGEVKKPGIVNLLKCKCPRCRRGDMFLNKNPYVLRHTMKMHKNCPVCDQPFNMEVGFYYGAGYSSYIISVVVTAVTFFLWWGIVGFSLYDDSLFYWIAFNAILLVLLQPYLMRLARTSWLATFLHYDKNWWNTNPHKVERSNEVHEAYWP